ncbi:MAG: hypothetical protein R2795_16745 [Saprospiraceae bacterium]
MVTAGIPRKPGMSRDDLITTNAKIAECHQINYGTPANPIIIVVSNPLDVMTYAATKHLVWTEAAFGMVRYLRYRRYRAFLATALDVSPKDIQALLFWAVMATTDGATASLLRWQAFLLLK